MKELLKVTDLHVYFDTSRGTVRANNGVNLEVYPGESTGIIGESGCGKTVLFLALLRLQQPGRIVRGTVCFEGIDLARLTEKELTRMRGRQIGLIPQNPATALNPAYTIEQQMSESIGLRDGRSGSWPGTLFNRRTSPGEKKEIASLLTGLGMGEGERLERILKSYPHQLSGGMRQRILTGMALSLNPRLVIADEPTTALDRISRDKSLELLKKVKQRTTLLIVSHDIEAITGTCERTAVMYSGKIIERGLAEEILSRPLHPYTRALLSLRKLVRGVDIPVINFEAQDLINLPFGCSFQPFCNEALDICQRKSPEEYLFGGVTVACHRYSGGGRC